MKPLWAQMLAWVLATLAALLLALSLPDGVDFPPELPHGANAPR